MTGGWNIHMDHPGTDMFLHNYLKRWGRHWESDIHAYIDCFGEKKMTWGPMASIFLTLEIIRTPFYYLPMASPCPPILLPNTLRTYFEQWLIASYHGETLKLQEFCHTVGPDLSSRQPKQAQFT